MWFHGSPEYFPDNFLLTPPDERNAAPIHFGPDWEHAAGCRTDVVFVYTLETDDPAEHLKLKTDAYEAKWARDCRFFYEVEPVEPLMPDPAIVGDTSWFRCCPGAKILRCICGPDE